MRLFAAAGRRGTTALAGPVVPLLDEVADALPDEGRVLDAAAEAGRRLAGEGVPLAEALERLRTTWEPLVGGGLQVGAAEALAIAWSEAALAYVHRLGCEDPLTGLAGPAHLRTRLTELARPAGASLPRDHALVVVEPRDPAYAAPGADPLAGGLAQAGLGSHVRDVFAVETVAALGPRRLAVLAARDDLLARRVALLRRMLATLAPAGAPPRVWVEPLPEGDLALGALVEELVRA